MENPVRFADRTRWAKFSIIPEFVDRPLTWNLLCSQERVVARQTTGIILRMLLGKSK